MEQLCTIHHSIKSSENLCMGLNNIVQIFTASFQSVNCWGSAPSQTYCKSALNGSLSEPFKKMLSGRRDRQGPTFRTGRKDLKIGSAYAYLSI